MRLNVDTRMQREPARLGGTAVMFSTVAVVIASVALWMVSL